MNMELTGKKINFLGDSITEGCCATSPEKGYVDVMKRKYRLTEARNYGIGGTRIARQRIPSGEPKFDQDFCGRFSEMNPDADIIVVFGGTNDHGHGDAPMGTETDRTPDTFIGACHFLFSRLPNQFPGAIIVVLTPLHRMGENIPKGERGWLHDIVNAESVEVRKIEGIRKTPAGTAGERWPVPSETSTGGWLQSVQHQSL